ncbi:MAG: leucine-rich repeat protein [Clostridiales bacterium]|nr:leucine-rich repeat protein [Clostridiales bacterium]
MEIDGVIYCSQCARRLDAPGVCPFCGYDEHNPPTVTVELEEGTLLNGRYQLGRVLGNGGFGLTYVAWDYVLGTPVAVKEYFPRYLVTRNSLASDDVRCAPEDRPAYELGLRRFVRESHILATLQSVRGIVTVHDFFEDNGTAYLVMELVRGTPLGEYARLTPLKPARLFSLLREPIETLAAVHRQGVLHRDISPSNLIVQEDGSVKLIDFGAAATLAAQAEGRERTVVINEAYAAPEQYSTDGPQGPWTDVYNLCATIYAVLTGEPPVDARRRQAGEPLPDPAVRGVRLTGWQRRALRQGLLLSPLKRTQSMDEFRCRLFHLPMPEEVVRHRRAARRAAILSGVAAALLMLLSVNFLAGFPLGDGLRYALRGDGLSVTGYAGAQAEVLVPATRLGLPVTRVGPGAFEHSATLESVRLPATVTAVSALAFHDCPSLRDATLDPGVREIEEYAFADCPALETVTLPGSVTAIADSAFTGSEGSLTLHGERDTAAEAYGRRLGIPWVCDAEFACISQGEGLAITACYDFATDVVLPDSLDGRPVVALRGDVSGAGVKWFSPALERVTLPEGLTALPEGALTGYKELSDVRIGSRLSQIGDRALKDTSITAVELPEGLAAIGEQAFFGTYLQSVTLPDSLTSIGREAFAQSQIDAVTLPRGLTSLGDRAFAFCLSLREATLSPGVPDVPASCFLNCEALQTVDLPLGMRSVGFQSFAKCATLQFVGLPEGLASVGRYAFYDCSSLLLIRIPASVTEISDTAFIGCPVELTLAGEAGSYAQAYAARMGYRFEDMGAWYDQIAAVRTEDGFGLLIGEADPVDTALLPGVVENRRVLKVYDGTDLEAQTVSLPYLARDVSTQAFVNNQDIREVIVGPALRTFYSQAFLGCASLTAINFPAGLEKIGMAAFENCASLRAVTLPSGLRRLEALAFYGCAGLTQVDIPPTLTSLEMACFGNTGVRRVVVPGNISKIVAPFFRCAALESVTLEEGVRNVWCAFSQCPNLQTVVLPQSVRQVSRATFDGCAALRDVWIYAREADLDFELDSFSVGLVEGVVPIEGGDLSIPHLFASCPEVTLHGYAGSTAEEYAARYGLRFEPIPEA